MTFEVIMIICALASVPDPVNCNEKNAINVVKEERDFSSMHSCFMYAMHRVQPLIKHDETFSKVECRGGRST